MKNIFLLPGYIISKLYNYIYKMEMEEILESIKTPIGDTVEQNTDIANKREKLISAVLGGGKYIERKLTVETLNNMSDEEINKEFDKYERRLGAVMVTTLGKSLIGVYTSMASYLLPISPENKQNLTDDLIKDPFLDHALNKTCCELYYKYGMLLAPLTTSLTTFKYCDFKTKNSTNKNGNERGNDFSGDTTTDRNSDTTTT